MRKPSDDAYGRKSRWTGADHDEIEVSVGVEPSADAVCVGDLGVCGIHECPAVVEQYHRCLCLSQTDLGEHAATGIAVARLERVEDSVTSQEATQLMRAARPCRPDDRHLPLWRPFRADIRGQFLPSPGRCPGLICCAPSGRRIACGIVTQGCAASGSALG